jgi:hypothetical protein
MQDQPTTPPLADLIDADLSAEELERLTRVDALLRLAGEPADFGVRRPTRLSTRRAGAPTEGS